MNFKLNWKPDLPDARDFKFSASISKSDLPKKVDLRDKQSPVYNQLSLGSCTANAICGQFDHKHCLVNGKFINPSRLFLYYNEREMEGTVHDDSGAYIRDGIKSAAKHGICTEATYPYNINKFTEKPPAHCYSEALNYQTLSYERIATLLQLKQALAQGHSISFGFSVYESFQTEKVAKTGKMRKPRKTERLLGGHAVLAVGYDDSKKHVIVKNSWGTEWGDNGYFYMPYSYITPTLTDDFWVIKIVE